MGIPEFEAAMRRVITGESDNGRSRVIIDGGPANATHFGGLFEVWSDQASGPLDARDSLDRGEATPRLLPPPGGVKVRWTVVHEMLPDTPREDLKPLVRAGFDAVGAGHCIADQERHPMMHRTASIDVICVLQGEVKLVLDDEEIYLKQGSVIIQRATARAWEGVGGPALLLAVLIDRS